MNLMQDQNPGGHKEDRASFPNQIQYKVSKIHTPNPNPREERRGTERRRAAPERRAVWSGAPGKGERRGVWFAGQGKERG